MKQNTATIRRSVADAPEILRGGDVELDRAARRITVRGERWVLPRREFDMLELLMANAGRALARETLLALLWQWPFTGDPKTLETHVLRLRRKIEVDKHHPVHLHTVRGYGYLFDPEADPP